MILVGNGNESSLDPRLSNPEKECGSVAIKPSFPLKGACFTSLAVKIDTAREHLKLFSSHSIQVVLDDFQSTVIETK